MVMSHRRVSCFVFILQIRCSSFFLFLLRDVIRIDRRPQHFQYWICPRWSFEYFVTFIYLYFCLSFSLFLTLYVSLHLFSVSVVGCWYSQGIIAVTVVDWLNGNEDGEYVRLTVNVERYAHAHNASSHTKTKKNIHKNTTPSTARTHNSIYLNNIFWAETTTTQSMYI